MDINKEIPTEEANNQEKKSPPQNKAKTFSSFTPLNEKGNPGIMSRQNSAFKNFKSGTKFDNIDIFPNATPRKSWNGDSIISPFKDQYGDTPFKRNLNMSSPEPIRFNSPMIGIVVSDSKNYFYRNNTEIQGKKIDFNPESNDMIKLNYRNPQPQTNAYNNRTYNNYNNNFFNQNSINIVNNNIDYSNQKPNATQEAYIDNNKINNINNMNNTMHILSVNNSNGKCTCSKTGCRKKYCACFSRGKLCDGCECKNCQNFARPESQSPIKPLQINEDNIENPKTQRAICNCTKSNCMKKYCECYKRGFGCNSLCRCLDCKNKNFVSNINNINNINTNNITINNEKGNYNMNINNENSGYNNNYMSNISNMNSNNNNDSINTNNFYNYALHNNINNNIINNNIINNSYIPCEISGKLDYSNPANFQFEAFGICIKKDELKLKPRKIYLNNNDNMKEALNNNFSEINETPKFSNKKRLRTKNESSTGVKTCPTTNSNSANKLRRSIPLVNKYIKKKRLQLS